MASAPVRNAELSTAGLDDVVVTALTEPGVEVTTRLGGRATTTVGPHHVAHFRDLEPGTTYDLAIDGLEPTTWLPPTVTTLSPPPGEYLSTFATVNDVHFGEVECGKVGGPEEIGPIFSVPEGATPYPIVMNEAAVREIEALDPIVVVAKGDLTAEGLDEEYAAFLATYRGAFRERLVHVRGNHDGMHPGIAETAPIAVQITGVTLAVIDTVIPGHGEGCVLPEQLAWLDAAAAVDPTLPMLVFGHHPPWDPASRERNDSYFGINPTDSEALADCLARNRNVAGYFAGHTHRNRVRRFPRARNIPIVEVACVKDYPGSWAEYRVYEGGYVQIVRRITAPAALDWTEQTREMFVGLYHDYAIGPLSARGFTEPF
jgi:Icc protein